MPELTWNEEELRIATLQILLAARKKDRHCAVSIRMAADILGAHARDIESAFQHHQERNFVQKFESGFVITRNGFDYLRDCLEKVSNTKSSPEETAAYYRLFD